MEKRLFIFVEGLDDSRFFRSIVVPELKGRYKSIEIIMYAGMKNEKVSAFTKSIRAMGHDFIIAADIDRSPSVRSKKRLMTERYGEIEWERMYIVIQEIESWYLAGISDEDLHRLGLPDLLTTDEITKEDFNRMMPEMFRSRIAFLIDLMKCYSIPTGRKKNRSFDFFADRLRIYTENRQ
jgi:hypothetical protein